MPSSGGPLTAEFEVGYIGIDGAEVHAILINSAEVRFELGKPVRSFSHRKRQRHFPGLWWSSTTGGHVGYESWLERNLNRRLLRVISRSQGNGDGNSLYVPKNLVWLMSRACRWRRDGRRGGFRYGLVAR